MQAFVHLTLFSLLFVIVSGAGTPTTAPAGATTPAGPGKPTTAPAGATTPAGPGKPTTAPAGATTPAGPGKPTTAPAGATTPAGPGKPTTAPAGATTPAGPGKPTTAPAGATTPAGPGKPTTAPAGATTPAGPGKPTTAPAGATTPAGPGKPTTAPAGATTPAGPGKPTTAPAGATTPAGPGKPTTAPAGATTPAGPGKPTTAPAGATTPAGPGKPTTAPAGATTPAGPGTPTTAPAGATTPAGPGKPTTAPAGATTPAGPGKPTTAPAGATTPAGPGKPTTAPAGATTPAGPGKPTTAPAGATTPAGPGKPTTAPAGATTPAGAGTPTTAPAGATTPAGPGNPTTAPAGATTPAGPGTPTTAPAGATTPAGPGNPTTAPAGATTPAGPGTPTTAPAGATTPAGANNTTPAPATPTAPTTFIKGNSTGTIPSVTSSSVTSLKTSNPNPDTTSACQDDSCTGGSYCVSLNTSHFCLCVDGFYYNSSNCKKGKVFPGIIQVKTQNTSGLENEKSINYENLYMEVNKFFADVFTNSDYGQTVIHQVSISAPARSQIRAGDEVVSVTVVNLFAEDTKENEKTISAAIHNATSSNSNITNYTNQDRCEFYGCKTGNNCSNGFQCECQDGYERPDPYTATCLPLSRKCPYACNSKPNTQCLVKDNGSPDCVCLAGYKKYDHEKCEACAFGYNGVNCEDNFQLILTVLGTIAGILILGMVIALIFMRSKKTKDIEEEHLIENDFQNLKLQQTTGFSFPAEGSIFPKITASFPRDSGMQNPYANPRGIPRPDY